MSEMKLKFSMEQVVWCQNLINTEVTRYWRSEAVKQKDLYDKYVLPADLTLLDKLEIIEFLKLYDNNRPRTLLDVGTGMGHFLTLLKSFHHTSVQGADIKEALDYFKLLHRHYGISTIELDIKPQTKFNLSFNYNIITVSNPLFVKGWSAEDWQFFKDNLLEYITPGGELLIQTLEPTGFTDQLENFRVPSFYFKK